MKSRKAAIQPRFRVVCGRDIALGPGKAELLECVQSEGSIAKAAKRMGMSYMRAWMLLKTMERCFRDPIIRVERGGARHGGAELTANGRRALELYRAMETKSVKATAALQKSMLKLLRARP